MVIAPVRVRQVQRAKALGLSVRRACRILDAPRSLVRYAHQQPMQQLAAGYPRYGDRTIRVLGLRAGRLSAPSGPVPNL